MTVSELGRRRSWRGHGKAFQVLGTAGAEESTEAGNGKKWSRWWSVRLEIG